MAPQKGTTPKSTPRGQKRAATAPQEEDQPALKVLKQQGISKTKFNAVVHALDHQLAEGLPDECREMLKSAVLTSLCMPKDERHEIQTGLVEMIGTVIDDVAGKLQRAADQAGAELAEVEQAHKALADAAGSAELALAGATEVVAAKRAALETAQAGAGAAEKSAAEKREEQRRGDERLSEMAKEAEAVATALSSDLAAIVSGEGEQKHVDSLVTLAAKLKLEESLLEAMPEILAKKPEARGSFDEMVFAQLRECLETRAKGVAAERAAEAGPTAERAAAVAAMETALGAAVGLQEQAAEALRAAEAQQGEAQAQKDAADQQVSSHLPARTQATEALENRQFEVDSFAIAKNVYQELHDKVSKAATAAAAALASSEAVAVAVAEAGA